MKWLTKLFNATTEEERKGISISVYNKQWEIDATKTDLPTLFRAIIGVFPQESNVYIEGTSISDDVVEFLQEREALNKVQVEMGTVWPRPQAFHIPATEGNLKGLAELSSRHAESEICDHFHIYHDQDFLLEGCDILGQCLYIAPHIPEAKIKEFAKKIGGDYSLFKYEPV